MLSIYKKPVIHLYTICWNEMDILPFVIDYWKRYVTKAVVYDNGSTDGSIEFLKKYKWIEVRHFDSEGFDDFINMRIKNLCWKESRGNADWVVVCDMDEVMYSKDFFGELRKMREEGSTIMLNFWYALCGNHRPKHSRWKLLHEQIPNVVHQVYNLQHRKFGKILLFDPNEVDDIGFSVGSHMVHPTGKSELYISLNVFTIHINKGFGAEYAYERNMVLKSRIPEEFYKKYNFGIHYVYSKEEFIKLYNSWYENSFNINEIINKKDKVKWKRNIVGRTLASLRKVLRLP